MLSHSGLFSNSCKWNRFFCISHFSESNPLFSAQTRQGQEIGRWSGSGLASQPWAAELLALKLRGESHAITCDINHILQKHSTHHEHILSLSLSSFLTESLHFSQKLLYTGRGIWFVKSWEFNTQNLVWEIYCRNYMNPNYL